MEESIPTIKSLSEEDMKKLGVVLKYFDLEDAVKRYEETRAIFDFGLKHVYNPETKIPMEFLLEGIKSYFFDFDEATIFYSSLAVELMLLRKTSIILAEQGLSKPLKSSSFWWLIHRTKILDPKHVIIADKLRLLRNCYVHFQNRILYDKIKSKEHIRLLETYKDEKISRQMKDQVIKNVRVFDKFAEEIFPSFSYSLEEKKNYINFMASRYDLWREWLQKEKGWSVHKLLRAGPLEFLRTRQRRFDALDALKWGKSVLEFCINSN